MNKPPDDMLPELAQWNRGNGIDLKSWIGCAGNFLLAIGYSEVFWPRFVLVDDYIFPEGAEPDAIKNWEKQCKGDKRSVEAVCNHLHIADIQHHGCPDITEQRIVYWGNSSRKSIQQSSRGSSRIVRARWFLSSRMIAKI